MQMEMEINRQTHRQRETEKKRCDAVLVPRRRRLVCVEGGEGEGVYGRACKAWRWDTICASFLPTVS